MSSSIAGRAQSGRGAGRFACLALVALLVAANPATAQFLVPATHGVSRNGAAEYTIPIEVPPGLAGMAPQLALTYDSQGGEGIAGVGWKLAGASSISRCAQTLLRDNAAPPVNYTSSDRYCLDGGRMVAVSGTDGADGTEYRTEIETFSRITSHGSTAAPYFGPQYFVVKTRGGLTFEYGNSDSSKLEATGKAVVRAWKLSRVTDRNGNFMNFIYAKESANGQSYLSQIDYTANLTASPVVVALSSVMFDYETRPDPSSFYQAGSAIRTDKRLKTIWTRTRTASGSYYKVFDYRLAYDASPTTGRSRLRSVTKCAVDGVCLKPVDVTYGSTAGQNGFSAVQAIVPGIPVGTAGDKPPMKIADFNNDGRDDILIPGDGTYFFPAEGTAYQFVPWSGSSAVYGTIPPGPSCSTGGSQCAPSYPSLRSSFVADMTGDGLRDLVVLSAYASNAPYYGESTNVDVFVNDGAGRYVASRWANQAALDAPFNNDLSIWLGDIDGDGRPDVLSIAGTTVKVLRNTGTSLAAGTFPLSGTPGAVGPTARSYFVDINGDGLADLVRAYGDDPGLYGYGGVVRQILVYLNNGSSLVLTSQASLDSAEDGAGLSFSDINGDGLLDLVAGLRGRLFDGVSFSTVVPNATPNLAPQPDAAVNKYEARDVNGDGRTDIVHIHGNFGLWKIDVYLSDGARFVGQRWYQPTTIDSSPGVQWNLRADSGSGTAEPVQFSGVDGQPGQRKLVRFSVQLASTDRAEQIGQPGNEVAFTYTTPALSLGSTFVTGAAQQFPRMSIVPTNHVVATRKVPNGASRIEHAYAYAGAVFEHGRGFMGFQKVTRTEGQGFLKNETTYSTTFPFTGMVESFESSGLVSEAGGSSQTSQIERQVHTFGCRDFVSSTGCTVQRTPKRYFPHVAATQRQELHSADLPITRTTRSFDDFGNVTLEDQQILKADGTATPFRTQTESIYRNDTANWYIGQLIRRTVTATGPNDGPTNGAPPGSSPGTGTVSPMDPAVLNVILQLLLDD